VIKFLYVMKTLILIQHRLDLWNTPAWFPKKLKTAFPDMEIVALDHYDGVESELRDTEVLFTISMNPTQFAVAQQLKWIHAPSAAVHQFLFPEIVQSPVIVTNSTQVHGPVVTEHVLALIFALAKKIPQAALLQQKKIWGQDAMWNEGPKLREIAESTLGMVGLGAIGRDVAKKASALGMRVIAVRENIEKGRPEGVDTIFAPSDLDQLLAQADFVVLAPPLTAATDGLMNAARFAAMKPGSYLINVGRGPLVNETALADALRARRIAGAALDVFDQEPLPAESQLWGLDNLLITPHTAALTEKLWDRHYELFSENLRRYIAHEPLLFTVDKQRGY
jgi:phosphoglycerate dehydrogenase-like enzyme